MSNEMSAWKTLLNGLKAVLDIIRKRIEKLGADVAQTQYDVKHIDPKNIPDMYYAEDRDASETVYHKIPIEFIPDGLWDELDGRLSSCMASSDPSGTGSFSMNRKSGTRVGAYSHAEGDNTAALARGSHAEGSDTIASGYGSHAEGDKTIASGYVSHTEGYNTTASASGSHAEGYDTTASGYGSHAEGDKTTASGNYSHAEGYNTIAKHKSTHACGEYNLEDPSKMTRFERGTYAVIVGNGTSDTKRSNAHTLDWSGNAWFAGTVEGTGIILKSSTKGSSKRFLVTVDDTGTLSATEVTTT